KAADPLAMVPLLVKFLELGKDMAGGGSGGESDPVTAFIQNLPMILPQAQALLAGGGGAAPAIGQPPAPAPATSPAPGQQHPGPKLVLTGPIAEQLAKTHAALLQ